MTRPDEPFLPQIIKELGVSNMEVGWLTMIPYIA
jgi:cyanate permease